MDQQSENQRNQKTWIEEIQIIATELASQVRKLLEMGNARRLAIRKPSGNKLVELPLTASIVVGAILLILAPILVAVAAIAALVAKFRVEIFLASEGEDAEDRPKLP